MIFNISLFSWLVWDSFLLPADALVYIHHLGIWLVSWSPAPRWAVTEGMKKTDTSISHWSCQNHEGICKGRESESVFFPPQWAVAFFVFSYLIGFTVLQSSWAYAKGNESGKEFVYEKCLWVFFFSAAVNEYIWVFVCICLFCHAAVCIFRGGTKSLWDRHPATAHCEDYPQIQCLCSKSRDFSLPTYASSKWIFA